jgi:hypothetical protein
MGWRGVLVITVALGLGACGNDVARDTNAKDGGVEDVRLEDAGAEDAGFEPELCPDPSDPEVHYVSGDPNACRSVVLDCTFDQNGFDNACGCGCIDKGDAGCPTTDDGNIVWVSKNPAECPPEPPACALNEIGFSNTCGCGCKQPG